MKELFDKIPPIFKNFYLIAFAVLFIWILVFDKNDLITHIKLRKELNQVEKQKVFYSKKIKEVEQNRKELEDSEELLEKYAREKYLMKKDKEDLYIIEKEKKED